MLFTEWAPTTYAAFSPGAAWSDDAFVPLFGATNFGLRVIHTTTDAGGANPAATEGLLNELRAKNIPKAFGSVSIAEGSPPVATMLDGLNATVSMVGTDEINPPYSRCANYRSP